jgi:von Willebrand factor type A domain
MSIVTSSSRRKEAALRMARRRLRRLEIETHRIKAELARLEAANEDDIADELVHEFRVDARLAVDGQAIGHARLTDRRPHRVRTTSAASPTSIELRELSHPAQPVTRREDHAGPRPATSAAPAPAIQLSTGSAAKTAARGRSSRGWLKPAWTLSLGFHVLLLLVGGLATFATLTQNQFFLQATAGDLPEETLDEPSEVEVQPLASDEFDPQDTEVENPQFEPGQHLLDSLTQKLDSGAVAAPGDVGLSNTLPSDLGTLMAGGGDGTPGGGPVGSASFFGTHSQANRVVFVLDNSSSMKGGRLEAALAELVRSVQAMSARQSFYVIFVSDQPYPMFFPNAAAGLLPATAANKQRLAEWLHHVQLAGGKNRQLITAMDMAAALRPESVFLLWDGDMRYSERVRRDVMVHLTQPDQWNFTIHTLGMGVESLDSEQNLMAIATAHGGTYVRVDIPTGSKR